MGLEDYIYDEERGKKERFIQSLGNILYTQKMQNDFSHLVLICIGTDKIIGDSLGPLVGTRLIELFENYNIFNINIFGSLKENVNYINIQDIIQKINMHYKNACVIVIDAALSTKENVGKIFVSNNKVYLGKSFNKNKIEIGDISIKAVVGRDSKIPKYNYKTLQTISLAQVIDLSKTVAEGIFEVIKYT